MKKLLFYCLLASSFFAVAQTTPEDLAEIVKSNPDLASLIANEGELKLQNEVKGDDKSIDGLDSEPEILESDNLESRIFGFDFINDIPKSISSTSDLPVPNDYVISLGDELRIILTGGKEAILNLQVGMDGSVLFPELGAINVFGQSIKEVRKTITELTKLSYVGTDVSVSLETLAAKKINIIGAVKNPGTYIVSPFSTVISSLAYSGGFEDYASLRNISVIREGEVIEFDLYEFLIFGSRQNDTNIQQGDTISVKSTNNFVEISGAINRPKIYEYKSDDRYLDLISFALGFNRDGNDDNISVTVNQNGKKITKKIDKNDFIKDQDIEALYAGNYVSVDEKDIFVSGSPVTSGFYQSNDEALGKFLEKIKFSSNIYPFYSLYEKVSLSGLVKDNKTFSLADPSTYSNLNASKNTTLYFLARDELEDIVDSDITLAIPDIDERDLVSVSLPNKTIRVPLKGNISPKQLHLFFGSNSDIELEKVSVITSDNIFSDAYEDMFLADEVVAISFPPVRENIIEVTIEGEVLNPGIYLVPSSTSLSDLYVLAGGFRSKAFESGINVSRAEVKERQIKAIREAKALLTDTMIQKSNSISERGMVDVEAIIGLADLIEPTGRIAGDFGEKSETSQDFILKDGDLISVPSMSYEVVVQGEVLNSSSFIFDDSMDYLDYIKAAGGFSDYADTRSVFIIRSNGLSVTVGASVFSGQEIIKPGDIIVVPRNLDQLEALPLISMATKIIADIAFSAASLNAIQN
tara:strand:- start:2063 stop:4315 length:2253 start_codon:yes stop_codon:yes gene_type:complete